MLWEKRGLLRSLKQRCRAGAPLRGHAGRKRQAGAAVQGPDGHSKVGLSYCRKPCARQQWGRQSRGQWASTAGWSQVRQRHGSNASASQEGRNLSNNGGVKLHGSHTVAYSAAVEAAGEGDPAFPAHAEYEAGGHKQAPVPELAPHAAGGRRGLRGQSPHI